MAAASRLKSFGGEILKEVVLVRCGERWQRQCEMMVPEAGSVAAV